MKSDIFFSPEAVEDFKRLSAGDRSVLREEVEKHLLFEPKKTGKSRIKRLKGVSRPQFRLRIDGYRVFYDVVGQTVEVLAVVEKPDAAAWLEKLGVKQ